MAGDDDLRALFGARVREIRLSQDLSQEEIAFRTGLTQTYLSQVEHGKRNISLVNIGKLAGALGVTLQAIMPPEYVPPTVLERRG